MYKWSLLKYIGALYCAGDDSDWNYSGCKTIRESACSRMESLE